MPASEHNYFEILKKEIADTYRKTYPSCLAPVEEWKGQDIANFQEELIIKVKGRISEKWFYTHLKSQNDKLPRIDMLNMLSQYAGYQDWRDFTNQKQDFTKETQPKNESAIPEPSAPIPSKEEKQETAVQPKSKKYKALPIILAGITVALFLILKENSKQYRCCFVDLNGQTLISNSKLEVRILKDGESPVAVYPDNSGCFEYKTKDEQLRFVVSSPYYKIDTITRFLNRKQTEEKIKLQTNDYALMIHYFSTSNINDWKSRRNQLNDMISKEAKIFQVYENGNGMELYNKEEFINKITMPINSLKNIEILETNYNGNQIVLLRFIQTRVSK